MCYNTPMKVYVVRHGETPSNLTGIVAGRSEESLTENGRKQAQAVNEQLEGLDFDAVFVSPVRRTLETAEIIVPEYPFVLDDRITERDLGDLQNHTIDELWQMPHWNSETETRTPEGAETFAAGLSRVEDFLAEKKAEFPDGQILLITHSFISRCLWFLEKGNYQDFSHPNHEIRIYNF